MFTPRKLDPVVLGGPGRLWGYLQGGHEYADYYLARDGTPTQAAVELHGELITRGGAHVPGIDCNLSPPKSISAVLPFVTAVDRAELEAAHLAAVRVTVRELERRVAACRPTIDGEQVHTPGELAMACFTHHTSRPSPEVAIEPDRPPDPQLHSHVFVFNLAWCEPRLDQGRFLAVDSRPIFQFGQTAEAIYSCELAAQLQRLGYRLDWHDTRKGRVWELSGVDEGLTELFSSRHRHIDQLAARFQAEKGRPPTKLERRRLALQDRLAKTPACRAPHWPAYRQVLDRHGLAAPVPERTLVDIRSPLAEREATVRARLLGQDGLTGQDATFDEETVTRMVFASATGLLTADEAAGFRGRFLQGPDLVPVVVDGQPRMTTTALLAQEHAIVQAAKAKATTTVPAPTGAMIERVAAEIARRAGYELSGEQHQVVAHLCATVGWASLEGWAGTGKTTALRTVVDAYDRNCQPAVVVSTAADTARRTAHELDLAQGYTVEAFCLAVEQGRLHPDAWMLVIVEEACMVDTHRMHRLLQAAGPAIIRTLGDPEQAQAVGAAGWHAQVDQAIGGHAELATVVRQRDPADREVCRLIRQGHADQALANLHARGRVLSWSTATPAAASRSTSATGCASSAPTKRRTVNGSPTAPPGPSSTSTLACGGSRSPATTTAKCRWSLKGGSGRSRCGSATRGMRCGCRAARPRWCWCCRGAGRRRGSRRTRWRPAAWRSCTSSSTATASAPASTPSTSPWRRSGSAGRATRASTRPPSGLRTWSATTSPPRSVMRRVGPARCCTAAGSRSALHNAMSVTISRTTAVRAGRCAPRRRRRRACVHWPRSWPRWGPPRGRRSRLTGASLATAWDWSWTSSKQA